MVGDLGRTFAVDLASDEVRDRILGCWQGKNAGGTLGTPLEEALARDEPFDVWWYPDLREGGLPNDDFEMQLIWLKAIEEVGPSLAARDLSRYWLDHVGYNFDEYGLSKRNLKLGLEPPVSGGYNNWFVDCMGSPIRSEIWACLAPGAPQVAVRYAYQDAICDHAGGEGVIGELFNAALESAAFVVQDPQVLLDIALSYVPESSTTWRAVTAARDAHAAGLDWKQAREAVRVAAPHYNAQYSPTNAGFQVIGLLYGTSFGDGLCKTVNCGYDTDSSGAAIGSYLGIIHGSRNLPAQWVGPLGHGIATNESWGGVRHMNDGPNPVPTSLDDLIARIRKASPGVLRHHGVLGDGTSFTVTLRDLYADDQARSLLRGNPNAVLFPGVDLDTTIDYHGGPGIRPESVKHVSTRLVNKRLSDLDVTAALRTPDGWDDIEAQSCYLIPGSATTLEWQITAPGMPAVAMTNRLWLELRVADHPALPALPVTLIGAYACRFSQVYPTGGRTDQDLLYADLEPEHPCGSLLLPDGRPGPWTTRYSDGYAQPVADELSGAGAIYLQTFVWSPHTQGGWVIVNASCPVRYWLNGQLLGENPDYRLIRPNQRPTGNDGAAMTLLEGWNEVLVKVVHDGTHPRPELHLGFSGPDPLNAHLTDIDRTAFPWSPPRTGRQDEHPYPCGSNTDGHDQKQ